MIFFEDVEIGTVQQFGSVDVTREEVLAFAHRYDPQPFHIDDDLAAKTPFGKIAASGWHTGAMAMRVIVDFWTGKGFVGIGSPGLDELRWLKPVYPGDTLHVTGEIVDKKESLSKPNIGSVWSDVFVHNQDGTLVMRYRSIVMMLRRPT